MPQQEIILDINPNTLFWLDTICVPVGDNYQNERNLAISKMVDVYKCASLVLVLNPGVEQVDSNRDRWELYARITRTTWFRRLWTLHEAVLARRCVFQLSDQAIDISDVKSLPPQARNSLRQHLHAIIATESHRPYAKLQKFKSLPPSERIHEIWSTVQWRLSSNKDDETICLANMLDIPLTTILSIDRNRPDVCSERMKAFVVKQGLFPTESMFEACMGSNPNNGALSDVGFRWAPKTFVFGTSSGNHVPPSPLAMADLYGFHVKLPGIVLGQSWREFLTLMRIDKFPEEERQKHPEYKPLETAWIRFMVPFQWDTYYTVQWKLHCWNLTDDMLSSTSPALVLQRDLISDELDHRNVVIDGKRVRSFDEDLWDIHENIDELYVEGRTCYGIIVTVPKDNQEWAPELKADVLGIAIVSKKMFGCSSCPAVKQMGWPTDEIDQNAGYFDILPTTTKWCIR